MKTNLKNLTAFVLTLGLLTLSGCRETKKDEPQDDTHMEDDTHMDSNNGHMQNDEEHMMDDDQPMNLNEDRMEDEKQ